MGDTEKQEGYFEPNPEFLELLMSVGVTKEAATEALFCTGNQSVDAAFNYAFSNETEDNFHHLNEVDSRGRAEGSEHEVNDGPSDADNYKMTFVINSALKMGLGKLCAQVAHACLGLYREMLRQGNMTDILNNWEYIGEKKIVLKGVDHVHLLELQEKAECASIPSYLIRDAGKTQIPANSITVLSLFGLEEEIDKITGKLSLL